MSRHPSSLRLGAALAISMLVLSACGYKGDLTHPKPSDPDPELVSPPTLDNVPEDASALPTD